MAAAAQSAAQAAGQRPTGNGGSQSSWGGSWRRGMDCETVGEDDLGLTGEEGIEDLEI